MPRIECRPDQVFPELLEARLLIPGELSDDAPELIAVVPLTWDWLGWGTYAFAIPRGNCHVHMNLTCSGPAPDQFGLHFSLYGRDYAGGFLKPVRTMTDAKAYVDEWVSIKPIQEIIPDYQPEDPWTNP